MPQRKKINKKGEEKMKFETSLKDKKLAINKSFNPDFMISGRDAMVQFPDGSEISVRDYSFREATREDGTVAVAVTLMDKDGTAYQTLTANTYDYVKALVDMGVLDGNDNIFVIHWVKTNKGNNMFRLELK